MAELGHVRGLQLRRALALRPEGRVEEVVGLVVEGTCPQAAVGDLIEVRGHGHRVYAEVIGLRRGRVLAIPLGEVRGIAIGDAIIHRNVAATVACGESLLGRAIDATGRPIDHGAPLGGDLLPRAIYGVPPPALSRRPIEEALSTGLRAIDGPLTLGRGQRVGIMAGAGVGKSRLLADLVGGATADVVVVALIGERGREVGEFLERTLTPQARARSVAVVATSDQSPLLRMRGAFVATAVAEHFAAHGADVLLVMDSLTRFAMAQREIGLAVGEPPATRGYTPSVFAMLPRLLERAGRFQRGSVTGVYTVLVEGDDLGDPVGDSARSILDGHIVLSRSLAGRGHFPAIDVLASVSRVQDQVVSQRRAALSAGLRRLIAELTEAEELVAIGAHVPGASPAIDGALARRSAIHEFLRQAPATRSDSAEIEGLMAKLVEGGT